ncbi:hypothetical protein BJ165DRAFT_1595481 [Panaeolus papilionaceus]|nr:hypothetical protein BJ165DRAFT_1595481 [Panaeolus papilionaceus]
MTEIQNKLPGFGLPLNHTPHSLLASSTHDHLYPNCASITSIANEENALSILTLRELEMLRYINEITDEEDWDVKIHDPSQISSWRTALQRSNPEFSDLMFEYCMGEVRWKSRSGGGVSSQARGKGNPPPVAVFDADVIKHDRALSGSMHEALKGALDAYEASLHPQPSPNHNLPNPNHATKRTIIDPSHYPLIFGKTLALPDGKVGLGDCVRRCGDGVVVPRPILSKGAGGNPDDYSLNYQWLPCEVDISGDEASAIHPLSPHNPKVNLKAERRIPYDFVTYSNEPDSDDPGMPQQGEEEDEDEFSESRREYVSDRRVVHQPEPDSKGFVPPKVEEGRLDFRKMYGTKGLQVVVRAAHVSVNPRDEGIGDEEWHIEGILNEHIIATAIYTYTLTNLTVPPTIGFKHQFSVESIAMIDHAAEDHEHDWLEPIFGLSLDDDAATQVLGSIKAREGRLIVFPNVLQSQFQFRDLKLEDPTKSGSFSYVAIHLVDPTIPILSTAHVPCQNREWWFDEVLRFQGRDSRLLRLPKEVLGIIGGHVEGFMFDYEEAEEHKVQMAKRVRKILVMALDCPLSVPLPVSNSDSMRQKGPGFCEPMQTFK